MRQRGGWSKTHQVNAGMDRDQVAHGDPPLDHLRRETKREQLIAGYGAMPVACQIGQRGLEFPRLHPYEG